MQTKKYSISKLKNKVLIVTYYWPPSGGSGVQRWLKFARYLPQFNWLPHIFTPENPAYSLKDESLLIDINEDITVIKQPIWEPYNLYQKLTGKKGVQNFGFTNTKNKSFKQQVASWVRANVFVPDPRVFWVRPSVKFLKKYLTENNIKHIITTGPPHSMHLIGLKLKQSMPQIKWIADMRDPWASFDVLHQFNLSEKAKQRQLKLEKKVLDVADKIVLVSKGQVKDFQKIAANKLEIITNGFDDADFKRKAMEKTYDFTISHIGLLNELRDPKAFFIAVQSLASEYQLFSERCKIRLVGNVNPEVKELINQFPFLKGITKFVGYKSHHTIIKEYELANLLLLVPNQTENGIGQIPGKIFEYMASETPVLALSQPSSTINNILTETGIGQWCNYKDVDLIKKSLKHYFDAFKNDEPLAVNQNLIQQYSRKALCQKLSILLESLGN